LRQIIDVQASELGYSVYTLSDRQREPDVFAYLDYRAYLRDYYALKKAAGKSFSFRTFSRKAKLRSPNYLKLVMDGARNLTREMAARFAAACGLTGEDTAYFVDLVAFNQSATTSERNAAYQRLTGFRRYRSHHKLELAHAAYHATWYLPAVRELAARLDFRDDPVWIASRMYPRITRGEAAEALSTLLELGLLVRDAKGRVKQDEPLVTTGPETKGLHIHNYHRMMMQRAADALELVPAPERDISALTLCLGDGGLVRLKERLQRFRRELLELSALEEEPRQVVQLNFQLFPLSRDPQEEAS
jgi:uncharacterized protein (TIGR02147 family)